MTAPTQQQRPQNNGLQRVESYSWPRGHVGHLTENQQARLEKFKVLSEEQGYYLPAKGPDHPPSHDDETMLRYLRARKFIPKDAFAQFKDTEDWRIENQLDTLYETIDIDEYEKTRRLYPQWTGRRDKRGIPFYIYELSHLDTKEINGNDNAKLPKLPVNAKTPRKMLRLFSLYENLCRFVLPLCSAIPDRPNGETPVSQSNNLIDLSNVGFTKFWALRNHMSDAARLATAHYPETLDHIFVVGAPNFFPTLWSWAQRWFDPVTVAKIHILTDKTMASKLAEFIDMDDVPKKYGGNLDWKYGDMPMLDSHVTNALRWKDNTEQNGHRTFPIGPLKWQYDDDGDLVAKAIGTENGAPRNKVLAGLHVESSGVARLALSPGRADKSSILVGMSGAALTRSPVSREAEAKNAPQSIDRTTTAAMPSEPEAAVPPESRAGTYTLPTREGTSETRFEQQDGTHSEGQMANGTPAITIDSQGQKQSIMDPSTIGQAAKEHPLPEAQEPQPTIVEKVQDITAQAVEQAKQLPQTAMAAVGLSGGEKQAEHVQEKVVSADPQIDNLSADKVEDFLRHQTQSTATASRA